MDSIKTRGYLDVRNAPTIVIKSSYFSRSRASKGKYSNDKYLKLYKIDSTLVDHQTDTLENSLSYTHTDEDLFLGFKASSHETLKETYNDKYEYILPQL